MSLLHGTIVRGLRNCWTNKHLQAMRRILAILRERRFPTSIRVWFCSALVIFLLSFPYKGQPIKAGAYISWKGLFTRNPEEAALYLGSAVLVGVIVSAPLGWIIQCLVVISSSLVRAWREKRASRIDDREVDNHAASKPWL